MQARRGAHFVANAVPFFAFMVGGSYGISVLLQVRDRATPASTRRVESRIPSHANNTEHRRSPHLPERVSLAGSQRRARCESGRDGRARAGEDAAGAAEESRVRPGG